MKITRLKKGYRINLSNAEWAVLERTVRELLRDDYFLIEVQ